MPTIDDLFMVHTARSSGYESYQSGGTAFVTNGLENIGVLGFVTPKHSDKVFSFTGIILSTFLEATVQVPPFVARGNGGSGLIVLEPKEPVSVAFLGYIAAYINSALRWRFSWYRQATASRVKRLPVPLCDEDIAGKFQISPFLPAGKNRGKNAGGEFTWSLFQLGSLYDLRPGNYHCLTDLEYGNIPLVSCGNLDNGVAGFVSAPSEHVYSQRLTIAFNGSTLTAKHHPYEFAAKDDVAVCFPKYPLRVTTELLIQAMLGRERWRFSYYRKCYRAKLERLKIPLPAKNGRIDEDAIQDVVEATPYWPFLAQRLRP